MLECVMRHLGAIDPAMNVASIVQDFAFIA
jgi:hypothetical protein